jgi:hypothetical protein
MWMLNGSNKEAIRKVEGEGSKNLSINTWELELCLYNGR